MATNTKPSNPAVTICPHGAPLSLTEVGNCGCRLQIMTRLGTIIEPGPYSPNLTSMPVSAWKFPSGHQSKISTAFEEGRITMAGDLVVLTESYILRHFKNLGSLSADMIEAKLRRLGLGLARLATWTSTQSMRHRLTGNLPADTLMIDDPRPPSWKPEIWWKSRRKYEEFAKYAKSLVREADRRKHLLIDEHGLLTDIDYLGVVSYITTGRQLPIEYASRSHKSGKNFVAAIALLCGTTLARVEEEGGLSYLLARLENKLGLLR